jgi:hypothetical protein
MGLTMERVAPARRHPALRTGCLLGACLPILLMAVPGAGAAGGGLVVVPRPAGGSSVSYLRLTARPGTVAAAGSLALVNRGARTLRVALRRVPGRTIDTLGSTYAPPGTPAVAAASWLGLAQRRVTLPPGGEVDVPVSVAVPRGAPAGDLLAGVDVEALGQAAESGSRGVSIASVVRYVIGVEVSVPGPRHPLIRFTGAAAERQPSALVFLLHAANLGNAILPGVHGAALITRGSRVVAHVPLGPGTFVTASSISYPIPAPGERAAAGTVYRVRAYLRYGPRIATLDTRVRFGRAAASRQAAYGTAPAAHDPGSGLPAWLWAVLGAVLLYGTATTTLLLRRHREPPIAPPVAAPGGAPPSGSPAVPPLPPVTPRDARAAPREMEPHEADDAHAETVTRR